MKKIILVILILSMLFVAACTNGPFNLLTDLMPTPTPTPTPTPALTPTTPEPVDDYNDYNYYGNDDIDQFYLEVDIGEIMEMRSNARWVFEQIFLPGVISEFHESVIEYLRDYDEDGIDSFMVWAWSHMTTLFIDYEFSDRNEFFDLSRSMLEATLGDEHIVEVTIERLNDDVIAAIIKLLDMEESHRSTYVGIVYSGEHELRLFTLEQSAGFHMFCFIGVEQRGSFFPVDNDREAFVEAILEVIETGMDAGASLVWDTGEIVN